MAAWCFFFFFFSEGFGFLLGPCNKTVWIFSKQSAEIGTIFTGASIFKVPTRLPISFLSPEGRKWLQQPNSTIEGTKLRLHQTFALDPRFCWRLNWVIVKDPKNPSKLRVWYWYHCIFYGSCLEETVTTVASKMGVFSHIEVAKILSLQSFFSNYQVESWRILYTNICHEFFRDF